MDHIKVLKVKSRVCWVIFIISQSILVGLMIATLSLPHWVKLTPTSDPRYEFQGSLLKITDGLTAIPNPFAPLTTVDVSSFSYATLSCSSQYIIDVSLQVTSTIAFWDLYSSWSTLFSNLWFAGGLYLVFELSALVCLAIIIVSLILLFWDKFYFSLNICASLCSISSHIIALIGWIFYLNVSFTNNCSDLYNGTSPPTVCATDGPRIGILVLILLPVVMIPYLVVLVLFKKQADKLKVKEFDMGIDEINTTRTNNPIGINTHEDLGVSPWDNTPSRSTTECKKVKSEESQHNVLPYRPRTIQYKEMKKRFLLLTQQVVFEIPPRSREFPRRMVKTPKRFGRKDVERGKMRSGEWFSVAGLESIERMQQLVPRNKVGRERRTGFLGSGIVKEGLSSMIYKRVNRNSVL